MTDFTYEDFQKVAKEVADHISKKAGLTLGEGWNVTQ